MYNRILEYLLDYDAEKTISKRGMILRRMVSPFLRAALPLTLTTRLKVVRKEKIPNTPVIFASTHTFKDDIEDAVILAGRQTYILIGSLSQIFKTAEGLEAWLAGLILVNRSDKESRKASKEKMLRALRRGGSVILFPEGAWNQSPNQLMGGLFSGVYDVAKQSGAMVVPIATMREEKDVYGIRGAAFDIAQYDRKEGLTVLRDQLAAMQWELMETRPVAKRSDYPYGAAADRYWKKRMEDWMAEVKFYDYEEELRAKYVDRSVTHPRDAFAHLDGLIPCKENAFLFRNRSFT